MIVDLSGHNNNFSTNQAACFVLITTNQLHHVWDSNIFSSSPNPFYCYYCIFVCMISSLLLSHGQWSIKMASNSQEEQLMDFTVAGAIPWTHCGNCHFHPSKGHRAQTSSTSVLIVIFAGRWISIVQLFVGKLHYSEMQHPFPECMPSWLTGLVAYTPLRISKFVPKTLRKLREHPWALAVRLQLYYQMRSMVNCLSATEFTHFCNRAMQWSLPSDSSLKVGPQGQPTTAQTCPSATGNKEKLILASWRFHFSGDYCWESRVVIAATIVVGLCLINYIE